MRCIIIEDQPPAQRILKKYIEDLGTLELTATFSSAIEGMEYLRNNEVDLIFLDIHLPKISGIDFLKTIPNAPNVILTTAFPDYALESYELNVIDYLLKPFSFQRFIQAVSKVPAKEKVMTENSDNQNKKNYLFVKSGHEHIKVYIKEILFIKSDADYTEIHTAERKYLSSEPLKHWIGILDGNIFYRIHKSYIINTERIKRIAGGRVYLSGQVEIPIGRAYKDEFVNRYIR